LLLYVGDGIADGVDQDNRENREMARPGVSKQRFADAATSLHAQGRPITARLMRIELGDRGSYTTISRMLGELGAKCKAMPKTVPEVPEELQKHFAAAVVSMWRASSEMASKRVKDIESQCEQQVRIVTQQRNEAQQKVVRLEKERGNAVDALSTCNKSEHLLKEEIAMLRDELRIQKAVHQRTERDRDEMLRQFAPLVKRTTKGLACGAQGTKTKT
jgi:uncharacterized membrane protein YccC